MVKHQAYMYLGLQNIKPQIKEKDDKTSLSTQVNVIKHISILKRGHHKIVQGRIHKHKYLTNNVEQNQPNIKHELAKQESKVDFGVGVKRLFPLELLKFHKSSKDSKHQRLRNAS